MTTIRPNSLPLSHPGAQAQGDRLAAQRAFFAQAMGQAQGAGAAGAPASAPPPAPAARASAAPSAADGPQKILRPGSIIDIRV